MRLAARLVAVSPSILFVSFDALGLFFLFLVFLGPFSPFSWGGLAFCVRVGSRSSGFLVGSRSAVRSLPERLTVSRNLIGRDFGSREAGLLARPFFRSRESFWRRFAVLGWL